MIVLGLSNPVASVAPIIDSGVTRRAVSRIVLLETRGRKPTSLGVAEQCRSFATHVIFDSADAQLAEPIRELGLDVAVLGALIRRGAGPRPMVDAILHPTAIVDSSTDMD